MGVIEQGHNFDLIDKDSRVFNFSFGDTLDNSRMVGENFLFGLINNSICPPSNLLNGVVDTLMN